MWEIGSCSKNAAMENGFVDCNGKLNTYWLAQLVPVVCGYDCGTMLDKGLSNSMD